MNIQVKSSGGVYLVPIESRFLTARKVFLEGEITDETASNFLKEVLYLTSTGDDKGDAIDIFINSPGGLTDAGLLIYDCIQGSPVPIRLFCLRACSMAAVLLASGRHGSRFLLPHTQVMIHEPRLEGNVGGSASSLRSISENLSETKRLMEELLARHTGRKIEEVRAATSFDHYLSPQEAVDFGLADEIISFERMVG